MKEYGAGLGGELQLKQNEYYWIRNLYNLLEGYLQFRFKKKKIILFHKLEHIAWCKPLHQACVCMQTRIL